MLFCLNQSSEKPAEKSVKILSALLLLFLGFLSGAAQAKAGDIKNINNSNQLNHVAMVLTAEDWVKTDTAKVTVMINAALDKAALSEMRAQILENLNKIAGADWHITDFQRAQDSSGLEKLVVSAEARIAENRLTNLNEQAKSVSKPGVSYKIEHIDFTPSQADIEKVKTLLRQDIYRQVQAEIETLNKLYPQQQFSLHTIRFNGYTPYRMMRTQVMLSAGGPQSAPNKTVVNTVSSLVSLNAAVDIASSREDKKAD